MIVVATPRELQEMDISLLLELPAWLEDECELDILNLNRDAPDSTVPPFLVIQSSGDKNKDTQPGSPQSGVASQSGRGASVVSILLFTNIFANTRFELHSLFQLIFHPLSQSIQSNITHKSLDLTKIKPRI